MFFFYLNLHCLSIHVFSSFFLETLQYLHFIPAENVKQLYKKIFNIQI